MDNGQATMQDFLDYLCRCVTPGQLLDPNPGNQDIPFNFIGIGFWAVIAFGASRVIGVASRWFGSAT